ncbi:MAG: 1-(5-phosphoribosyl)-5-[(5-phosphoribosylamino)methylideneamino] imidazole-4-carboxamide isomerase [Candidatus Dormibacter sp.]
MVVIPSVDVRGGRVVRLLRGDYARETVYADDPVAAVQAFVNAGARRVHIVDLDAARGQADPVSTAATTGAVAELARNGAAVQVGGGVRDRAAALRWFGAGASWVVIGSLALRQPDIAHALCEEFPGRVLVALDVDGGEARAEGWTQAAGDAGEHLDRWAAWPIGGVVHTEIDRDGTLTGPALPALRAVCARFSGPVFASGGVTTIDDVAACAEAGAAGAIVGRALHQGLFDLGAALARFGQGAPA